MNINSVSAGLPALSSGSSSRIASRYRTSNFGRFSGPRKILDILGIVGPFGLWWGEERRRRRWWGRVRLGLRVRRCLRERKHQQFGSQPNCRGLFYLGGRQELFREHYRI